MIKGFNYSADQFRDTLKRGTVHFWYTKTNGEEREAYGTLDTDIIEEYYRKPETKGKRRPSAFNFNRDNDEYIQYFDLYAEDKKTGAIGGWRSFRIDGLIQVDDEYDAY